MAIANIVVGASNSTLYTSSVTGTQIGNAITTMIICNTTPSTSANLTLYAVPSGGTANAGTMIVNALTIPPGETVSLDQEKMVLGSSDTIQGFSSQATTLTFTISTLPV
jgi:hypothetical protein